MTKKEGVDYVSLYRNKKYRGKFVALKPNDHKVVGCGQTPEKAEKMAVDSGVENTIITRVPNKSAGYLLL
ncbi:MAG: DUF5678 domain-containing protein [Candidatus Omnitrophota bacterium]